MALPSGASIIQVTYADRRVLRSHVFHDFASLGLPDAHIRMPYSLWIVDTADGPLVVDTGFHVPDAYWAGDAVWRTVPEALDAVGVDPRAVERLVLSHLHFDHAGNVDLFPNARVHVARQELDHAMRLGPDELRRAFVDPAHLDAVRRADAEGRLVTVGDGAEPAPGVTLIAAPGHTPGQLAVLAETRGGRRLLASDAAHFFEQLELGWRFFAHTDAEASDRTVAALRARSEQAGAPIIPGHDPRVRERYPALPGAAARFATVLA